jgi:hypothetical protein
VTSEPKPLNFAYFMPQNDPRRGLFVLLETSKKIASVVVFGNKGLDWKEHGQHYPHLWHQGEIGDTELRTEAEATAQASDMGLDLAAAKELLVSNYTKAFGAEPMITEPKPSLENRASKFRKAG